MKSYVTTHLFILKHVLYKCKACYLSISAKWMDLY
jgi:hypothetical protein